MDICRCVQVLPSCGIDIETASRHAWHKANAKYKTHEAGTLEPDALGLHDLWGNASEWCVTDDDTGVTLGGCYKDKLAAIGCAARIEPIAAWNARDPQFPKSVWWLADAGFVGLRVICENK